MPFSRTLLLRILLPMAAAAAVGCARVEVEQGNYLTRSQVSKLEKGMNRQAARRLLGKPLIQDPFHPDRWDYVFYRINDDGEREVHRRLTLFFDREDRVSRILKEGPPYPEAYSPDQAESSGSPSAPGLSPAPEGPASQAPPAPSP